MRTLWRWVRPSLFHHFFAIFIGSPFTPVNAVASSPKQAAIHLSLSALSVFNTKQPGVAPTLEALTEEAQALLPDGTELPEEFSDAVGEMYVPHSDTVALNVVTRGFRSARAPNAELPNTAAFLGGLVAQEVIKVITKQYVPIEGYCCVDLVETWTGMLLV